jgi:hypothetical protein
MTISIRQVQILTIFLRIKNIVYSQTIEVQVTI